MNVSIKKICEMLEDAEMNLADKVDSSWIPSFDASIENGQLVISCVIGDTNAKRMIAIKELERMVAPYECVSHNINMMIALICLSLDKVEQAK